MSLWPHISIYWTISYKSSWQCKPPPFSTKTYNIEIFNCE
jgi:hypothetical protein